MSDLQSFIASRTPPGWETRPLWSLFRRRKRTGFADEELLSVYRDYGVIPKSSRDDNHNKESDDLSGYQLVTEGSLVTNKMKAWQGSIAISRYRGIVSPAYYVYEPLSQEHDQFLHYLLRSEPYIALYGRISKGVRVNQWDLEHEALRNVPVMLPDLATQKAIADFLDRETVSIDRLIDKKRRLVDILLAKRSSEISISSNKGLQPGVQMKQSAINDGELIPYHWEERRLSTVCRFFQGKAHEHYFDQDGNFIAATARFVSTGGVKAKRCSKNLSPAKSGDILMVMSDLPDGRALARAFLVQEDNLFAVNQRVCALSPQLGDSRFFAYQLDRNDQLLRYNDGFNQTHLKNRYFLQVILRVPPVEEQVQIADRLDKKVKAVDEAVIETKNSIERLQELRAALITSAVTGQIDVTTWGRQGKTDRRLDEIEVEMNA